MTSAEFAALRADPVPKLVVAGVNDPQMSQSDMAATARRIGAPSASSSRRQHLTMIASPRQLAAVLSAFAGR